MADVSKQIDFLLPGLRHPDTDAPLSGGKVKTFLDGTSTLSSLFTDRDKVGTADNPVILDSSGSAEVFGDEVYKMEIYDSDDNLLDTLEGLEYEALTATTSKSLAFYDCNLATAVASIGAVTETLLIVDCDPDVIDATVVVTANITLQFEPGFIFEDDANNADLTISGEVIAEPNQQILDWGNGTGEVTYRDGQIVNASWHGSLLEAIADISSSSDIEIQIDESETISTSTTVTDNIGLRFINGAILSDDGSNADLTIDGALDAEDQQQIFDWGNGSGNVIFSTGRAITLEWFGAVPDDSADVKPAFDLAVGSIDASGGTINILDGTYRFATNTTALESLSSSASITIKGISRLVSAIRVVSTTGNVFPLTDSRFITFEDLNFTPATQRTAGALFALDNTGDCNFNRLRIATMYNGFDCSNSSSNNVWKQVEGITFTGHNWNWFYIESDTTCSSFKMDHVGMTESGTCTGGGFNVSGIDTLKATRLFVQKAGSGTIPYGMKIDAGEFVNLSAECTFEVGGTAGIGIQVNGGSNLEFIGVHCASNKNGIQVTDVQGLNIIGGRTYFCQQDGILLDGGEDINLTGHKIYDNGQAAANTYDGIVVDSTVKDFSMVNCHIGTIRASGIVTLQYGVSVPADTDGGLIITNNTIDDTIVGTAAINHTFAKANDAEKNYIIRDNVGHDRNLMSSDAYVRTTDATETTLWSYTLNDNEHMTIVATVSAQASSGTPTAGYVRIATVYRDGGAAVLEGSVTSVHTAEWNAAADCTIDVDTNDVRIRVTGLGATTIDWTGHVEILGKVSAG